MLSLNSMQCQMSQIACGLGELASIWSAARTKGNIRFTYKERSLSSKPQIKEQIDSEDVLCSQLNENFLYDIGLTPQLLKNIPCDLITPTVLSPDIKLFCCKYKKNYISTTSFFENKTGFSEENLKNCSYGQKAYHLQIELPKLLKAHNPVFMQSTRGFKTIRSKGYSGLGAEAEDVLPSRRIIKSITQGKSEKTEARLKNQKLNELLSSKTISQEEADKIKIAFAEGYSANSNGPPEKPSRSWIKWLIGIAVVLYIMRSAMSSVSGIPGVKLSMSMNEGFEAVNPEDIKVTFRDVKGCDEAKQELQDVVEFLKNQDRFKEVGAKLPKGVLLVGPPGIGKTLLARAVAGEAVVPFFHASGSEFDEMFVGTGAKRVRALFDAAKASAPCVIFIDEIDTVGAKRTSSTIHPYANQTINQLLTEMDGFTANTGVIVVGATNKKSNLDSALLRPGRFDVEVRVYPPDLKGRKEILDLYMAKIKYNPDVSIDKLAKCTPGCTGAELENIVNQAAIKAALEGELLVTGDHLEFALDKVLMGTEKKHKIPDKEVNWCTAYHEAGHAIVAYLTKDALPVRKVTIMPRGMSLGHTSMIPEKDRYNLTKSQLLATMDVAMGGRVAEELIYGKEKVTTGAGSDFSNATGIATSMVKHYGMSERIGVRVFSDQNNELVSINTVSPNMTEVIDAEIKRLLEESYNRAKKLLTDHLKELNSLAAALEKYETLDLADVKCVMDGKPLNKSPAKLMKEKDILSDLKISELKQTNGGSNSGPNLSVL